MPYQPNSTIADLLLRRGQIQGDATMRGGQAWAQGIQQLSEQGAGIANKFAEYKMDEPRRKVAEMKLAEEKRVLQEGNREREVQSLIPANPETGAQDPRQVVKELRLAHLPEHADRAEARYMAQETQRFQNTQARIAALSTATGKSQEYLRQMQEDPSRFNELRAPVVDMIAGIDEGIAREFPRTYKPDEIKGLLDMATHAKGLLDENKRNIALAEQARNAVKGSLEQDALWDRVGANAYSMARDAGSWVRTEDHLRELGMPDDKIKSFGPWSESAADDALERGLSLDARYKARNPDDTATNSPLLTIVRDIRAKTLEEQIKNGGPKFLTGAQKAAIDVEAVRTLNEGTGTGKDKQQGKDEFWEVDRTRYEDEAKEHARQDALSFKPRPFPDWDTWRYDTLGRGVPTRQSKIVRDRVKQEILQAAANDPSIPIKNGEVPPELVDKFLASHANRRKLGILR